MTDVKRLIGRRFSHESVQNNIKSKHWPFTVLEGKYDKPLIVVSYMGEQQQFSAQEISSMVLVKMKETAEVYLGTKVKNAVITVPAYFNNAQRQATIDAGTIAGLNVMQIINEPTAAAIAYAHETREANWNTRRRNVLVFDLGGGTFDVSLVIVGKDSFKVKAVSGDTHLGGVDFDSKMVDHFVAEFKGVHNIDISGDPKALGILRAQCERAKRTLSSTTDTKIVVGFLYEDTAFSISSTLSRDQFESMNLSLFKKCIQSVTMCLRDAKMSKDDVDDVVLVGVSTRIPKVQQFLREYFDGKVLYHLNPDEAVAYGATIHAAILSGVRHDHHKLEDVAPFSLRTKVSFEKLMVVIPRNTRIPTKMKMSYFTAYGNQITIPINVYEGESLYPEKDDLFDLFIIDDVPPAPKGTKVITTFEIDVNSILTLTSEAETNWGKKQITDITKYSGKIWKNEIDRMVKDAKKNKLANEEHQKLVKARSDVQKFASHMSEALRSCENNIKSEDKLKVEDTIEHTTVWLDRNVELNDARKFEDKLNELRDFTDGSMVKEAMKYKKEDMERMKLRKARLVLEKFVSNISDNMNNYYNIKSEDKKKLKDAIQETNQWLDMNVRLNDASKFEDTLKELQDICNPSSDASGTPKKSFFFFFSYPEDGESRSIVQDKKHEASQEAEKETFKWLSSWMLT